MRITRAIPLGAALLVGGVMPARADVAPPQVKVKVAKKEDKEWKKAAKEEEKAAKEQEKAQEKADKEAAKAQKKAAKMEEKMVTTSSGLKYVDLEEGKGAQPRAGQRVTVHYTGWLKDGKVFDSSKGRGPFSFVLGARQVIAGWDEGVATMKIGGKRRLVIPSQLAYGERGFPGAIPPNSELTFEVELLGAQ